MMLRSPRNNRNAFTLVELMVSITIIAILAATVLFGMSGVQDVAKAQRTKSQLMRIHEMLADRWESYETRRVRIVEIQGEGLSRQMLRLRALRELIRLEMPDRITDILPNTSLIRRSRGLYVGKTGIAQPALHKYYVSRASADWSKQHEGAECLYLILSKIQIGDSSGLEFLSEREIGDVDGDGMNEILDGWGNPIQFVRWAPGYANSNIPNGSGVSSIQNGASDTMDLAAIDPRMRNDDPTDDTFVLFPLVFSTGADGKANIATDVTGGTYGDVGLRYRDTDKSPYHNEVPALKSDPFVSMDNGNGPVLLGQVIDMTNDGHIDNIYNHHLDTDL